MPSLSLDKKDLRLLAALDLDSRSSLPQLAKRVGLSKQGCDYRLKRLVAEGVIKRFYTQIDFAKLGYTHYKLYLAFQDADEADEKAMIGYWLAQDGVIWAASCHGPWHLAVSLLAENVADFGLLLDGFLLRHGTHVLEKEILITQESPVYTRSYLGERKQAYRYATLSGSYESDDTERKLLRALSKDARMSIVSLMRATGLTRDVIVYRMRKLQKEGIIVRHRILVDTKRIGRSLHKVQLRLHSATPERLRALQAFVEAHPHGMQYLKLIGPWDAELEFEVKDDDELHAILRSLRAAFGDIVRAYDTLLVREEHKQEYYPF